MAHLIRTSAYTVAVGMVASFALAPHSHAGKWESEERDGRIEARDENGVALAWQLKPLADPKGGEKFSGSAFLHSLRTPSGFEWTTIQPDDHKHHFGLWWPWKYIEVEGGKYNTWEIQEGTGAHTASGAKKLSNSPESLEWEFVNTTVIKKPGAQPQAAIHEIAVVGHRIREDAQILDISIQQKAVGPPVKIVEYRYSGFSWRGPTSWNKDNSTMTTSEGKGRDNANGVPARWVVVSGPTPHGTASILMMSAASENAGKPEKLRVWDATAHNGTPFVNFNPVMDQAIPLDDAHPAVSNRKYRVIAADHTMDAAAAEAEWKSWMKK